MIAASASIFAEVATFWIRDDARASRIERYECPGILGEYHGDGRPGGRGNDHQVRPSVSESRRWAEAFAQVDERATGAGKHGAELCDAEREAERHQAPDHPHEGDGAHRACRFRDARGGAKDTAADDEPDHHGDGGHERQTARQLVRPSGRPGGAKEAAGLRW